MNIHRTLAATLAAMAISASAAQAMPADTHGSTAQPGAQTSHQDLRSPDAADATLHPRSATLLNTTQHPRKSPVVVNAPGATVVDSQSKAAPVAPGQPTWAVNPKPLHAPAQPASTTASDDGTDWVLIGLGAGLTLLVLGGIAALTSRSRALPRTRATV